MADRVHPSTKPTTNGTAATNPSFPATKAQLYGATRPTYRPQANRKRSRGCCCAYVLWTTVVIFILVVLAAIAGAIIYVLYRPHRPSFDVSGLKISSLNLTSTSHLTTNINLNITARNPNRKLVYTYNPITITVTTEKDGIVVGSGLLPSFVHGTKNTTFLRAAITSSGVQLDDVSAGKLKADLKSRNGVALKLELETKVKVKMGGIKTPKARIRVTCQGIKAAVPSGNKTTTASLSNAKCKVDLRIKIWKWTF
ncbi:LATE EMBRYOGENESIS ABUNDANT (LEA) HYDROXYPROLINE-RICH GLYCOPROTEIN FAMILY [Salix koriyanagi]|uniref:LATE EMBRYOGENESIS ABUNDANT (LEA) HYDROXYPROLINE-RICH GLYCOPROTEIN FAMILY n=1 Tax=Salix koriyanagi TaxID=2511006 RepID=A0A9Q0PXM4_9ROSI|nr:LATE EMBRYOGENESIS ABUNDANT (LEA) HYDROXYPROLINE-RICH GLYCOPROTEIN FAMILY [Salix koriyanagi]